MSKSKKYVLCICGGRDLEDFKLIQKSLDFAHINTEEVKEIIIGDGKGINGLAKEYCESNGLKFKEYKADWKNIKAKDAIVAHGQWGPYNKRAAADRDSILVDKCDKLLIIGYNDSKEVEGFVKKAKEQGKEFTVFELDKPENSSNSKKSTKVVYNPSGDAIISKKDDDAEFFKF